MEYRRLGKTELQVSPLTYGTWGFANDENSWIGATREHSEKALLGALEMGINFIDTARVYGAGVAEEWIGESLSKSSYKNILVASKIPPQNDEWSGLKGTPIIQAYPKSHILKSVDDSLKALRRDHIDLMYFHVWEDEWADSPEWQEVVHQLTQAGKVRYWGISTNDYEPANCLKACQTGLISVVMTIFNLFHQRPIVELFPSAQKFDLGIVARVPLDEGGLTGNITSETEFPEGDFRREYFSPPRKKELIHHLEGLRQYLTDDIPTIADLALRFILSHPQISSAAVGMRRAEHVATNIESLSKGALPAELLKKLASEAWERNFYD